MRRGQGGNTERIGRQLSSGLDQPVCLLQPSLSRGWWLRIRRGGMGEVPWRGAGFGSLNSRRFLEYWDIPPFGNSAVSDFAVFYAL